MDNATYNIKETINLVLDRPVLNIDSETYKISKKVIEAVFNEYTNNMKKIYSSLYECFNNIKIKSIYDSDENEEDESDYESVKNILETKMNRSDVEWGEISEFDEYVMNNIQDENVLKAINQIYLDNFDNEEILVKILHSISEIDYKLVNPYGQTIAIAAISNKNLVVKQKAIETFERWQNEDSIKILENIDVREKWLKKYVQKVLEDLREKLEKYD